MPRYSIAIDVERCTGCFSCFLACKDEYVGNDYPPYTVAQPETGHKWLRLKEVEHGTGSKVKVDYIPIMCQQCENPSCITPNGDGAVYRRPDGIVVIDPVKAEGRKDLVSACPYGTIFWNEESNVPQKCTLCVHMLENGEKTTRCVECCPTQAMVFGDLDDPKSAISKLVAAKGAESFKPEFGTKPAIKYFSLPKPFIAGEILLGDKTNECARGVKVTLKPKQGKPVTTTTDVFGDFEFKGLERNVDYTIEAQADGYAPSTLTVRTVSSQNVGEIVLQKR
jgi:Fe-S-cluster-containing dehydrogenase component